MQFLQIIFSKTIIVDDLHNSLLSANYKMNINECLNHHIDGQKCLLLNNNVQFMKGADFASNFSNNKILQTPGDLHDKNNLNMHNQNTQNKLLGKTDSHNIEILSTQNYKNKLTNEESLHNQNKLTNEESLHNQNKLTNEEYLHNQNKLTNEESLHNQNKLNNHESSHKNNKDTHKFNKKVKRKKDSESNSSSQSSTKAEELKKEDLKIKQKKKIIDFEILAKKIKEFINSISNLENNLSTTVGELKEKRAEERIYDNKIMDLHKFININNLKRDRLKNEILMLGDLIAKYREKINSFKQNLDKYKKEKHALSHDINLLDNEMCKLNDI